MTRTVGQVARDIVVEFQAILVRTKPGNTPYYIIYSRPYLKEMLNMNGVTDPVGLEDGVMVILYFLNNAHNWRGPQARRLKAELNEMLEEAKCLSSQRTT
jgi:hypothetical protein